MKRSIKYNYARTAPYLVIAATVIAVSFLFPTHAKFKYKFTQGQTWLYDDLYASFDFAIKKSEAELAKDRAQVESDFSPYYEIDLEVIPAKKKAFARAFDEQLRRNRLQFADVVKNTEGYLSYGNYVLEKLFNRGILQPDTFIKRRDKDFVVNILRGGIVEQQTKQNLLTLEKAKAWLSDSLPYSRLKEPEFLLPLIENTLIENLAFSPEKTKVFKEQELDKIATARGMVKSGELLVPKGSIITPDMYQKLISYREQYETSYQTGQKYYLVIVGYVILTALILSLFLFYIQNNAKPVYAKFRWLAFFMGWVVVYAYSLYGIQSSDVLNVYMFPFCIAPIVIKSFAGRELALLTHCIVVLTVGLVLAPGYEFILLQLLGGLVVVFARFDTRHWRNFFQSISWVVLVYWLAYIGLSLIEESNVRNIDWSVLIWLALNGFLTLLAYPLIPLLGGFFNFTSSITLAELNDLNQPLLKDLSIKAPGTLQHSLQVANLAESAAILIGADDLLVRVGALYHDIGKSLNPMYFIENQSGINPHDKMPRLDSARIIIGHVTEGVLLAEKNKLPKILIQFIKTHHGTTLVEYFYRHHVAHDKDGEKDKSLFQYPGPKPKTKEETILMLADSLEASSKSLKNPDADAIDSWVDKIVGDKIREGQLEESQLTFQELEVCKNSFKQTLKSIHHVRVAYPGQVNVYK